MTNPLERIAYKVSEDRKNVTLSAEPTALDAGQLDALINSLARLRSALEPAHPPTPPRVDSWRYYEMDGFHLLQFAEATTPPAAAGFHLALRSPGLGWCHYLVSPEHARLFAEFLLHQPPQPPPPDRMN